MERCLAMLEVSQKQSYIFGSNKLKDNIRNSAVIAWIMSPEYFEEVMKDPKRFNQKDNLVYSGGGHIVLEFAGREQAVQFVRKITFTIHREYPGIEVFAAVKEYEEDKNPGENLKLLTAALEEKKSLRLAAFHQGSFGIEEIDPKTLKPLSDQEKRNKEKQRNYTDCISNHDNSNFNFGKCINSNANRQQWNFNTNRSSKRNDRK